MQTRKFTKHSHIVIIRDNKGREKTLYSGNFGQCKAWRFHNRLLPEYKSQDMVINRDLPVMDKKTTSSTIWNRRV